MTVINTNIKSLQAQDALKLNERRLETAMERLSTGSRINSAADDAAGLSIATRMNSQVRGLSMAIRNANDAISVTQTAEGAMQEINDILQRMRELAVQSSNDANSDVERSFMQAEVSQLSDEIERIATTTQFNGINILDGGFSNKTFQIGANAGQTMGVSIGSMKASNLGVVTSQIQTSGGAAQAGTGGLEAQGVAAVETKAALTFQYTTASGTIGFTVVDTLTGLTAQVSAVYDISQTQGREDLLFDLNQALRQSAVDTSVTGITTTATTVDLTDADNWNKVKVAVQLDGGAVKNFDLRQRLLAEGVTTATVTNVGSALQAELRATFGDTELESLSVTVTANSVVSITDKEGRAISVSAGAGDGFLFNTAGSVSTIGTYANNISGAWEDGSLVLTNTAGGEIKVRDYNTTLTTKMAFDVISGTTNSDVDPVMFTTADYSNIDSSADNEALFVGGREPTGISIGFSQTYGTAVTSTATYTFKLTNGEGDLYGNVTLDLTPSMTNASVVATVQSALNTGLATIRSSDSTFDLAEWDIRFSNGALYIENAAGRALAVEDFSSTAGSITVTRNNEAGGSEVLASQANLFSETRIGLNVPFLSNDVTAASALSIGEFKVTINGFAVGSAGTTAVQITADGTTHITGTAWASALETKIQALTTGVVLLSGGTASAIKVDMSTITVDFDSDTQELVIRDSSGRAVGFGLADAHELQGTGNIYTQDFVLGTSNDSNVVKVDSATAQGDIFAATKVKMTVNQNQGSYQIDVNGQALTVTTSDFLAPFASSTLKTKLDAVMVTLNSVHPTDVFEYEVAGNSITIINRAGGDVEISDLVTSGTNDDVMTVTIEAAGETVGSTVVARQYDSFIASAKAAAVASTPTEVTLKLSGDDIYSITLSDGDSDYSISNAVLDVNSSSSVASFQSLLNGALAGSGIVASMDTSGSVFLSRADGGVVSLKSVSSVGAGTATWTPAAGQGDSQSGVSGAVAGQNASASSGSVGNGGSVAVAQISIADSAGAQGAIEVLDAALEYVNAERSKLGAVENRLEHTIDNLTNIVTNTQASMSRIMDTDYAQETAELARSQIIQQAATAMLAQANQSGMSVLSLLQ